MSENQASSDRNVFVSWSQPTGCALAPEINTWVRRVLQRAKPLYSPEIKLGQHLRCRSLRDNELHQQERGRGDEQQA